VGKITASCLGSDDIAGERVCNCQAVERRVAVPYWNGVLVDTAGREVDVCVGATFKD
jgi:hypothetical protein